MQWIELTVRTVSAGIDLLCAELTGAGFDSFLVEDAADFEEFLSTAREYWDYVDEALAQRMRGISQVRVYLPAQEADERLRALRELLEALPNRYPACDFGSLQISLQTVPDSDWENDWKKNYRPLPVGNRFLIIPHWLAGTADPQGRLPIILDLGLTFGTGEHASTQMCMRVLEDLVHGGERVADLGSGSGILSVCALRLGAAYAIGVDVDPMAERIARDNAAYNGFGADRFSAVTGNLADAALTERLSADGYDIVCANIVAGVIISLLPVVPRLLKPDGVFLCSGILAEREDAVRQAVDQAGLTVVRAERQGEWRCLLAKIREEAEPCFESPTATVCC